jgi:hypothetical protein
LIDASLGILYESVLWKALTACFTVFRPDFLSRQACPLHHLGVGRGLQDFLGEPLDRRWSST